MVGLRTCRLVLHRTFEIEDFYRLQKLLDVILLNYILHTIYHIIT
jgi:hypothetical protein